MPYPTQKPPHRLLIGIAAIITFQQCEAFCAKQKIAPHVDTQIASRPFTNEKGQVYNRFVVPYKFILTTCREIHTKINKADHKASSPEPAARPSSPLPINLSTSAASTSAFPSAPMTILQAPTLSLQSSEQAPSESSSERAENNYAHIPIPRLLELRKILVPIISPELTLIIESYAQQVTITGDWLDKNVIRFDTPKLTRPVSFHKHYLIFHHETETSIYDCKIHELVCRQKKQELLTQADMKRNQELSISLPAYNGEVLAEQKVLAALKASDENISSIEKIAGEFIAIGYKNGELEIRKTATEHSKKIRAFSSSITALHMLPSEYLAAGSEEDGSIQLWNPYTGYFVSDLPGLNLPELSINQEGESILRAKKHAGVAQLLSEGNMLIVVFDTSDLDPQKQSIILYKSYVR